MFRKRKSEPSEELAATTSAAKKPCANGAGAMAGVTSHENGMDVQPVDSKESVRNSTLIVRLPTQAPNAPQNSVIVIDDSDDEADTTPSDVKPDRQHLDEQIVADAASNADSADCKPPLPAPTNVVENTAPQCSHSESSENDTELSQPVVHSAANGTVQATSVEAAIVQAAIVQARSSARKTVDSVHSVSQPSGVPSSSSSASLPSQRRSSKSATPIATRVQSQESVGKASGKKLTAHTYQQTEVVMQDASIQAEASSSLPEQQLESLRSNVLQLLKTIVPSLTCSNLEFVDEIVVEMVRVNAESIDTDD